MEEGQPTQWGGVAPAVGVAAVASGAAGAGIVALGPAWSCRAASPEEQRLRTRHRRSELTLQTACPGLHVVAPPPGAAPARSREVAEEAEEAARHGEAPHTCHTPARPSGSGGRTTGTPRQRAMAWPRVPAVD